MSYGNSTTHFTLLRPQPLPFHEIPLDDFRAAFQSRRSAELDANLLALGKDIQGEYILRTEAIAAIKSLRGVELSPEERDALITYFSVDSTGVMSWEEFSTSVGRMQTWAAQTSAGVTPIHYRSGLRLREDKARHRRLLEDPQAYARCPVTSSQAVGWQTAATPTALATVRDPLYVARQVSSTDVQWEGRGAADYN